MERTPLRSRSSLSNLMGNNTPQRAGGKIAFASEMRRPPSSRSLQNSSPKQRPNSAMGNYSSRPTTPSFFKQPEVYTGTITVSIRPNPLSIDTQGSPWDINEDSNTITNYMDNASFSFDNVFSGSPSITNKQVYDKCCSHIISKFLDGYNGTIFAYGMTGSGKTFSMRGTDQDPGFIQLTIDEMFNKLEMDTHMSPSKNFEISVSYLEIYNEKIIDLLNSNNMSQLDLKIRDDPFHGTKILGITSPVINNKEKLMQLIRKGDAKRKTSATDYNSRSSRSHAILQIRLTKLNTLSGTKVNSTLSLCDLAGSERATSSLERRKEGSYINKSLLALSTVINKLSLSSTGTTAATPMDHIPYRDSKLTRLLQPALSGTSLISVLCTIHLGNANNTGSQSFIAETYNTLRFAARAKDVVISVNKNKPTNNISNTTRKLEELNRIIDNQKNEISMLKVNQNQLSELNLMNDNDRLGQLISENRILRERYEHVLRLNDLQKTETVILRNDVLNELFGSGIEQNLSQVLVENLEEFYKRLNHEVEEYKFYIQHLESELRNQASNSSREDVSVTAGSVSREKELKLLLSEKEEEIQSLREAIKDKDHIIKSLTKTSKLRKLVDSNQCNIPPSSPHIENSKDKNTVKIREFNIKIKKPHINLDAY